MTKEEVGVDALIVGGGIMGVCIARDLASCGYHVALVEKEARLGGVWIHNNYPSLRLQGLGAAWRCLSVPPAFQKQDILYRPSASETLAYIDMMAKDSNITTYLNTTYLGSTKEEEGADGRHIHTVTLQTKSGTEQVVKSRAVVFAIGYDTHRTGKPWMPVDKAAVKNGIIFHSADLGDTKLPPLDDKDATTFIVGAHKAAMEVLLGFSPEEDNVIWANRGHYTFIRGEALEDATKEAKEATGQIPWAVAKLQSIPTYLAYYGWFDASEKMMIGAGLAFQSGEPMSSKKPSFHGGVAWQSDVEHAQKFKQLAISGLEIDAEGTLLLNHSGDDEKTAIRANDRVILASGQRSDQTTQEFLETALAHSSDGLFTALPYSIQACTAASYTTKLVLDYLDGTENSYASHFYSSGKYQRALASIAERVKNTSGQSVWAEPMTMVNGIILYLSSNILPVVHGDLALTPFFVSDEWYGKPVDVRSALKMLGGPDYNAKSWWPW
jgi:thioredoxin reductase